MAARDKRTTDMPEAASVAGLRHTNASDLTILRRTSRNRLVYIGRDGAPIANPRVLNRIKALAIPPAWKDVQICAFANGHLQAIGRDARGRKQYIYHSEWRIQRDALKFHRMLLFGRILPDMRRRCDADLSLRGLPREKVLAAVVQLLEQTLLRVGNEAYARDNGSFGLTTMRRRHVAVFGSHLHFSVRGKSGKMHNVDVTDRRLAGIVKKCRDLPGQALFHFRDESGAVHGISSDDVNAYLHEVTGHELTAKDFRTWAGTVGAVRELQRLAPFETPTAAKANVVQAIRAAAARLGNTPAVCRRSYVHPAVIEAYCAHRLPAPPPRREAADDRFELDAAEWTVLEVLGQQPS
jgi:DNA topoisomerase-1